MIYNSVQSNTIALALSSSLGLDRMLIGGVVTVLAMAVICGGMGRIARVTEWMVPIMAGIYILITLGIMLSTSQKCPAFLASFSAMLLTSRQSLAAAWALPS